MDTLNQRIETHYNREGLYEDILRRLVEQGIDLEAVKRSDIAAVDEFHVRGAAVSKELAQAAGLKGLEVLDVGCGIGGPARMLAGEYDCRVTGIDLSPEFIRTARELSKLVRLDDRTNFIVGDASDLPFPGGSFDAAWTQHVQMNIPDKVKFYSGIARVLRPGGVFIYYDIFRVGDADVSYPMPWASTAEESFLFPAAEMHGILSRAGMQKVSTTDQTRPGVAFFEALLARVSESGPPKMGLHVIMGESTGAKLLNVLNHLKKGALALESGIYRKG